jgi:hypothetical protein
MVTSEVPDQMVRASVAVPGLRDHGSSLGGHIRDDGGERTCHLRECPVGFRAFLLTYDWFYDRRKNFYRNNGKSPDRVVSIPLLAQAVMAMGLSRPDNSRARPSSLLKRDEDYKIIFSSSVPLPIYLWLAKSQKVVDASVV